MAKKTRKAVKKLTEAVEELRERNEELYRELAERVTEALEAQTESNRALLRLLEERRDGPEAGPPQAEPVLAGDADAPDDREVTEAARQKARELGVSLENVQGTGAGGRILVRDVEEAAG